MENEINKWIIDTEAKGLKIRLYNNVYGTLIAIFRLDYLKTRKYYTWWKYIKPRSNDKES